MAGSPPKLKFPFDKKPVGRPTVKTPQQAPKPTTPKPPKPPGKVQMPAKPRVPTPKTKLGKSGA